MSHLLIAGAFAASAAFGAILIGQDNAPTDPAAMQAVISCADGFMEDGEASDAVALLTAAGYRPGEARADYEYTLAAAYHALHRRNEAHDHLQRALRADPSHEEALSLKQNYVHVGPQAK
ncbi:MAG: hypothetical protein WA989_08435 [Henriciella sp.]|uniref:hypothetical protein n=1 Tax=Henriciella sp. TaxID=1968823 RepID=UPI003C750D54